MGGFPWEVPWDPAGCRGVPRDPTTDAAGFSGCPRHPRWNPATSHEISGVIPRDPVGSHGIPWQPARSHLGCRGKPRDSFGIHAQIPTGTFRGSLRDAFEIPWGCCEFPPQVPRPSNLEPFQAQRPRVFPIHTYQAGVWLGLGFGRREIPRDLAGSQVGTRGNP